MLDYIPKIRFFYFGFRLNIRPGCIRFCIHDRIWDNQIRPIGRWISPKNTLANLWLVLAHSMGVELDRFADSAEMLPGLLG